ncbi:hypothetical protein [Nannocystis sp. SCPEA4]|uniref:hypothetical protein n=1 Tax=Nannocystis sp. SCPEA4 TaxID=2996787 RepID=UPI00226DF471|nr:hypothetical protein [Nannocystis sp. SCPEA4]MCY1055427.1 hypothetical protein [Nannocystis sp. SCPEA4]
MSTRKAVQSARLSSREARKRAPEDLEHAGVILVDERRTARTKTHGRTGFSSTFVGQSNFSFDLDAGLLVDALSTALLSWYRDSIRAGEKPDGSGRQPELTDRVKRQQGRASQVRGFKSGYFSNTIRRGKVTGSTVKAQTRIVPDPRRNVFVAQEAKRGVSYFSVQGTAAKIIEEITSQFIAGGLKNANRASNLNELDAKEAA